MFTDFSGSWVILVYQKKYSKRWLRITINYFKGLKYIGSIHLRFLIPDRLDLITTIKKECLCARNGKTFGSMSNVCSLKNGLKDFMNSERFFSNKIALEFLWNPVRILKEFRCHLLLWQKFNKFRNNVLYLHSILFCCNLSMVFLKLSIQNFVWETFNVYTDIILSFFDHHLPSSGHLKPRMWTKMVFFCLTTTSSCPRSHWTLPSGAEGSRIIEKFQSRNRSESHSQIQPVHPPVFLFSFFKQKCQN